MMLSTKLLVTWSTNHPISYSNIIQKTLFCCHLIYLFQIYQSPNVLSKYNTENFILPSLKLLVTWSIRSTNLLLIYNKKPLFSGHLIYWSQIYQSPNLLLKYNIKNFILLSVNLLITWSTNLPISYPNIIQKTFWYHHLNYWSPDLSNLPITQSPTEI